MAMRYQTVMLCGVCSWVGKRTLGENGRAVDPQDDGGWRRSKYMKISQLQALHAYALYWAIGVSSNSLYLLLLH